MPPLSPFPLSKRLFDIFFGFLFLLLAAPLFILIALLIFLSEGPPIFVRLERISEARSVWIYKFRTMVRDAKAQKPALFHLNERTDGPFFKIRNDPRVTRTGRILRRFRFDELPQLINVLHGELSLVGPRPHEPEEVRAYPSQFSAIPHARAGLTGASQVAGASSLPFLRELEFDYDYITHWSFSRDIKILLRTLAIFLFDPTAI